VKRDIEVKKERERQQLEELARQAEDRCASGVCNGMCKRMSIGVHRGIGDLDGLRSHLASDIAAVAVPTHAGRNWPLESDGGLGRACMLRWGAAVGMP
jgi:hypothetical protein